MNQPSLAPTIRCFSLPLLAAALMASASSAHAQTSPVAQNVVRVNVTSQAFDFSRPWAKRAPVSKRSLGAVLQGQRVLVTADCVANATYIELESPDGESKQSASVEAVDYEANLALLKSDAPEFLRPHPGLSVAPAKVGDSMSVWQLESNGNLMISKGSMTTAEVSRYPLDESAFLTYRVSVPLQMRDASATLPVLHDGKLAGLMLRYEPSSNLLDVIPAPVVEHFLQDTKRHPYEGFPRMGLSFSGTRDPQLRRFLHLENHKGGVLVTQTLPGGPADESGIQKGDVILEIDGHPLDADGNYQDAQYGRISLGHLVCTKHFEGEHISLRILREGKPLQIQSKVSRRRPEQFLSEPYSFDKPPRYFILGGLVFQELSRAYLREFGSDWARKAPPELTNLDRTQSELEHAGARRIVFLSRVLPSNVTIGYEELRHLVVRKINGIPLKSLEDLPQALANPRDGIHRIEFASDPFEIFLDAEACEKVGPSLQKGYRLPSLQNLPSSSTP
jgi:S1-C subfamily serine protease